MHDEVWITLQDSILIRGYNPVWWTTRTNVPFSKWTNRWNVHLTGNGIESIFRIYLHSPWTDYTRYTYVLSKLHGVKERVHTSKGIVISTGNAGNDNIFLRSNLLGVANSAPLRSIYIFFTDAPEFRPPRVFKSLLLFSFFIHETKKCSVFLIVHWQRVRSTNRRREKFFKNFPSSLIFSSNPIISNETNAFNR